MFKNYSLKIISIVFASINVVSGSAAFGIDSGDSKLSELHGLEKKWRSLETDDRYENAHREEYEQKKEDLNNEFKKFALLECAGKTYRAALNHVAMGTAKNSPYEIELMDDSIHLREGPPVKAVSIPPNKLVKLILPAGTHPVILRVGVGYPGEMHNTGYKSVVPVTCKSDGSLIISNDVLGEELLFVLIRYPGDTYIKKYVWLIE